MPMADMSTQAMRKEPIYDAEETAALAAYVASLALVQKFLLSHHLTMNEMATRQKVANYLEITAPCAITSQVKVVR